MKLAQRFEAELSAVAEPFALLFLSLAARCLGFAFVACFV